MKRKVQPKSLPQPHIYNGGLFNGVNLMIDLSVVSLLIIIKIKVNCLK
jgi:hypothetical protein